MASNSGNTYQYTDPTSPHQVSGILGSDGRTATMDYDNVGNVISRTGDLFPPLSIEYTPFNKPAIVTSGAGVEADYSYDADQARIKKTTLRTSSTWEVSTTASRTRTRSRITS
jgi:hypothetical protein